MLKIHRLALGLYQTNCYLIHDEASKSCCVIDPGYEAPAILREADHLGLEVEAILLTHGHFDHVGAVKDIVAETDCDVYICDGDLPCSPTVSSTIPILTARAMSCTWQALQFPSSIPPATPPVPFAWSVRT